MNLTGLGLVLVSKMYVLWEHVLATQSHRHRYELKQSEGEGPNKGQQMCTSIVYIYTNTYLQTLISARHMYSYYQLHCMQKLVGHVNLTWVI